MMLLVFSINLIRTSNAFLSEYTVSVIRNTNNLIDSNIYYVINPCEDNIHTVLIDELFISIKIIDKNVRNLHELVPISTKNKTLRDIYDILIKYVTKNSVLIVSRVGGNLIGVNDVLIICGKSYKTCISNFNMYNSLEKFYTKNSVGYYEFNNVLHFNMVNIINNQNYRLIRWCTSDKIFFNEAVVSYLLADPRWNIKSYVITSNFIEYMAVYKFIIRYLSKNTEELWDFSKVYKIKQDVIKLFPYSLSKKILFVKKNECKILRENVIEVFTFSTQNFSCIDFVLHYMSFLKNISVYERNFFILMFYSISIRDEYLVILHNVISSSDDFKFFFMINLLYLLDVLEFRDMKKYLDIVQNEQKQIDNIADLPKNTLLYELIMRIKNNMPDKDSPLKILFIVLLYESIENQIQINTGKSLFFKYLYFLTQDHSIESFNSGILYENVFKPGSVYLDINSDKMIGRSIYYGLFSDFNVLIDIIDNLINSQLFINNNILMKNDYFEFYGPSHLSRMTLYDNLKIYKKFNKIIGN